MLKMTRRELLGGALGAGLLAGCSDTRGRRLDGMDPRVSALRRLRQVAAAGKP